MERPLELTAKEKLFLASMDLSNTEDGRKYQVKFGCDPCDACGPSSCADCKACAESILGVDYNPFDRTYKH
jgi:hypothetical protein